MSRKRMIDPSFWDDEAVASWPLETRLTYIALWNHSDDYGVVRANPSFLHSKCFPYDSHIDMKAALLPLVASGRLVLFRVKGETYGHIKSFTDWQVINRPSKRRNPTPDMGSLIAHELLSEDRFYQPRNGSPLYPATHRSPEADSVVDSGTKPPNCGPLSESSVSPHVSLTPKLKEVKLKQSIVG